MEYRKIQKTGGTTYIVSLPKRWVTQERLKQGSTLAIEEAADGTLRVYPSAPEKETKETTIPVEENLRRRVIEKYLLGYDTLKINSKKNITERQKTEVKRTLQGLIGFEILEEKANAITIQSLLDPAEIQIMKSLRRMYTIVSVMHRDLIEALKTKDRALLRDVSQRDLEVNRLYFLVVRQIRTAIQNPRLQEKENLRAVDCLDARLAATLIEELGDALNAIAQHASKNKFSGDVKTLDQLLELHGLASKAFFTKNESLAVKAQTQYTKLKLVTSSKDPQLFNSLVKIADYGKDLADIVVSE